MLPARKSRNPLDPASKVCSPKFVRAFSLSFICRDGHSVYRGSVSIKGEQQARLTALHIRLQALESVFGYKERPLHRPVMTPKPHGTSGRIGSKDRLWFGKFSIGQVLLQSPRKSALDEARRSECS